MPWIESHTTLARHPKALRLSRRLGVTLPAAIGHLHLLWWWALEYAQEGDLSGFDAEEIALSCAWEGEPEHLVESLKACGFVDGSGAIHDWHDYAGKLLDQRKANAEKQARWRNRNRLSSIEGDNRNVTVTGETGDGDVTVTSPLRNGATVPNRTRPNPTHSPTESVAPDAPLTVTTGRKRDPLWDAFAVVWPQGPRTAAERGKWNKAAQELRDGGVTAEEIVTAAQHWPNVMGAATMTPMGLASNLGLLLEGPQTHGRSNGTVQEHRQRVTQTATVGPDARAVIEQKRAQRALARGDT